MFSDLHCVQRRAFAQIIGYAPEIQTVINGRIFAYAGNIDIIFALNFSGRDIFKITFQIDYRYARRIAECFFRVFGRYLFFKFN